MFVTYSVFESVYLSNRIVVMAARPGRVIADLTSRRPIRAAMISARDATYAGPLPYSVG